jgi:hypothetical protein
MGGYMDKNNIIQKPRRIHELTMRCRQGKGNKIEEVVGPEVVSALSVYSVKIGRRRDAVDDFIRDTYKGLF